MVLCLAWWCIAATRAAQCVSEFHTLAGTLDVLRIDKCDYQSGFDCVRIYGRCSEMDTIPKESIVTCGFRRVRRESIIDAFENCDAAKYAPVWWHCENPQEVYLKNVFVNEYNMSVIVFVESKCVYVMLVGVQ